MNPSEPGAGGFGGAGGGFDMTCPGCGAQMIREGTGVGCNACGLYMGPGGAGAAGGVQIPLGAGGGGGAAATRAFIDAAVRESWDAAKEPRPTCGRCHGTDHMTRNRPDGRWYCRLCGWVDLPVMTCGPNPLLPYQDWPTFKEGDRVGFKLVTGEVVVGIVGSCEVNEETGEVTLTVKQFPEATGLGYVEEANTE
jgi:hypothetical protein